MADSTPLNYHHLHYFWMVAREGSITRASDIVGVAEPTISAQLKTLERSLGAALFERRGRGLLLTPAGKLALQYADSIFSTGRELVNVLHERLQQRPLRLAVGIADVVPKLIAYRLLEPIYATHNAMQLHCAEGKPEQLVGKLAIHELDVVVTDAPLPSNLAVRAYNHLLGESGVTFFAVPTLARRLRTKFPQSLDGVDFLMPSSATAAHRALHAFFDSRGIKPRITGEFDDSALLKVFGQAGHGVFMAPTAIEAEIRNQYGVEALGRSRDVRERFYAISAERRLLHPAVVQLTECARTDLFSPQPHPG